MKKVVIITLFILCLASRALAVNPADTTVDYRVMPRLFCASYDEEATRSVFGVLPFNDSMITVFNQTKEEEAKTCLVLANSFSSLVDGGTKAKIIQNREIDEVAMEQEIGLDIHKGIWGLGMVIPFQGENIMLGLRGESKYVNGYIHLEKEDYWIIGTDLKFRDVQIELSCDKEEEIYASISYSIKTPWGCIIPKAFSDDDVWGGKLLLVY